MILARTDIARLLAIPMPATAPAASADSSASTSIHASNLPKREQQTTPRPGDTPPLAAAPSSTRSASTRPHSVSSLEGELESDVDSEDVERVSVSTGSGESASGASRGTGLDGSWVGLGSGGEDMTASTTEA
jgi:hypothetical protein